MKESFWHDCWENGRLGFHQDEFHPLLTQWFSQWAASSDKTVFVPLCGKSHDMVYIAQTHKVLGVELSGIACGDFFIEHQLSYALTQVPHYQRFKGADIELLAGDIFKLSANDVAHCELIFDRAALIALPQALQNRYVEHLRQIFPQGCKLFLLTLEYPDGELEGPPFSVEQTRVEQLFAGCHIQRIDTLPLNDKRFAQRTFKVSSLQEVAYFIDL